MLKCRHFSIIFHYSNMVIFLSLKFKEAQKNKKTEPHRQGRGQPLNMGAVGHLSGDAIWCMATYQANRIIGSSYKDSRSSCTTSSLICKSISSSNDSEFFGQTNIKELRRLLILKIISTPFVFLFIL